MRRDIIQLLKYEANRKPEIKFLLDNVQFMSENDINQAKVPMLWYKKALLEVKKIHKFNVVKEFVLSNVIDSTNEDPMGTILEWIGNNYFIKMGKTSIEISSGKLLWLPDTGGIWFETAFSATIDPIINEKTNSIGKSLKSAYTTKYKEFISLMVQF